MPDTTENIEKVKVKVTDIRAINSKETNLNAVKPEIPKPKTLKSKKLIQLLTGPKFIKGLLMLIIFAIPLAFQVGIVNALDFNKQFLLVFLSLLCLIIWLLKQVVQGKFQFKFSILNLAIIGFLITSLVSTIFSRWQWGSFWGYPLSSEVSFLTLLSLFIFYNLFVNLFNKKDSLSVQFLLVISGAFAALIGILQLSGKFLLGFSATQSTSFNTIGTVNTWNVFLQALIPLILVLAFNGKKKLKTILIVSGALIFACILISNYWVSWIGILFAMCIFFIFALTKYDKSITKFLLLPIILFLLAIFLGIIKIQIPSPVSLPAEVAPAYHSTLNISKQMTEDTTKELLFGWGPGTFKYGWSKFKDPSLNETIFWNLRFSRGGSHIFQMLGEFGILGSLFYILIPVIAVFLAIKEVLILQKKEKSLEWLYLVGILAGFISLCVTKFLHSSNFSLEFLWWFFLANIGIFTSKRIKRFELGKNSRANFLFSFLTILSLVGSIFLFYLQGTRFLAEVKHNKAFVSGQNFETIEKELISAVNLNPNQEIFFRNLAELYLAKANQEINRVDISDETKVSNIGIFVRNSVAAAGRATGINPENALNWQTRGWIYKNLVGFSDGAFEWAIKSYEEALKLEPSNPFIFLEMGRTYATVAGLVSDAPTNENLLSQAEEFIRKAVILKPDYAEAFYQMALIYDAQGKKQEALITLESLKQASPYLLGYDPMQDVGLAFQIGILYYQEENFTKAQQEFERALALNPSYANAMYFLGLVYNEQGETEKAITQFKEIEKYNPENQEIKKILQNLELGLPIFKDIIEQEESLPIQENMEEIPQSPEMLLQEPEEPEAIEEE
ncbi:MAG: tetratricopeptide repeat protein [Candidatus Pacebacteria bacterium]|nr:tetratricopeptide repeat protein [Candidatus Paceibacterota bacterium]